ncbi:hypothetical protein JHK85_033573 [Glycine max]|nr:hypothetical protein JHK85_033573 [Glycine max]
MKEGEGIRGRLQLRRRREGGAIEGDNGRGWGVLKKISWAILTDPKRYSESVGPGKRVVCVMLRLLTHALAAALKEGRKSLVMDAIFFHNVATLMNIVFPAASILLCKEQVVKMKVAKPATARTYSSVFDYCAGRCCHSSESVVHENAYISDFHHCFSLPSSSSGKSAEETVVLVMPSNYAKLVQILKPHHIQKYMSCKGSCLASVGADQPAEVVYDAPVHLNPGSCLYTETQSILSCDGLHQHTRRLCPCA